MEWPKLKNIILLILAATNVFLLVLVGSREWNAARYQSNARNDAIQILARSGISVDKEILPQDTVLTAATVTRDREGEAALLAPLLGEVKEESLGGGQYWYTGALGKADLLNRGEFMIALSPLAVPPTTSLSAHAEETLAEIGIQAKALTLHPPADSGQTARVTLMQYWQDAPILSCTMEAEYGDNALLSLSGTRLSGEPQPTGNVELNTVTGLLGFLEQLSQAGDVCSAITAMVPSYQLTIGLTGPASLAPVWYIETDAGSYTLDAVTAVLLKL